MMELLMGVASSGRRFWRRNFSRSRSAGAKNPATRRWEAVGHEPEGGTGLLLGDLSDVVPELFGGKSLTGTLGLFAWQRCLRKTRRYQRLRSYNRPIQHRSDCCPDEWSQDE